MLMQGKSKIFLSIIQFKWFLLKQRSYIKYIYLPVTCLEQPAMKDKNTSFS